jgi:hypothetical protein
MPLVRPEESSEPRGRSPHFFCQLADSWRLHVQNKFVVTDKQHPMLERAKVRTEGLRCGVLRAIMQCSECLCEEAKAR